MIISVIKDLFSDTQISPLGLMSVVVSGKTASPMTIDVLTIILQSVGNKRPTKNLNFPRVNGTMGL